jgi:hypothetical protein
MSLTIGRPHTVDPELAVAALTYIAERQTFHVYERFVHAIDAPTPPMRATVVHHPLDALRAVR